MPTKHPLLLFRNEINNIDKKIVELLAERKNLVLKIAKSKIENNQAIRDIEREKKILQKLIILGEKNNLSPTYITQLFQLIIEESVSTQQELLKKFCKNKKLTPAIFSFLGPKGSYSHIAACEYADQNFKKCIINECSTFQEAILSVEKNQSDYVILPIENTCSGSISEVFEPLKKTNLFIVGEINILINHCLLSIKKTDLNKIKTVYSHPQPFQQCSNFMKKFPDWNIKYTKSTAEAMKIISKYKNISNAALGSQIGGKIYGLNVLSKNLANQERNITRFILLQQKAVNFSEETPVKTTLIFNIKKEAESVYRILSILKEKKIIVKQLTSQKIDQKPSKEIFYIDIEANLSSVLMQKTLEKIKKVTNFIKVLGCYPIKNIKLTVA